VRLLRLGIARLLEGEDEAGTTIAGRYAFTPEYAAPAASAANRRAWRPDVYALGVILYELLAGSYALDRHDLVAAERVVRNMPPLPLAAPSRARAMQRLTRATTLRSYRAQVAGDLSHPRQGAREGTGAATRASKLSPTICAVGSPAPVRVSGNGFGYRLRKFVGRNRVAAALAALTLHGRRRAWQRRSGRCEAKCSATTRCRRTAPDAVRTYLMMFRDAAGQKDATKVNVRECSSPARRGCSTNSATTPQGRRPR
jgi:serine/threonine-protein kinase